MESAAGKISAINGSIATVEVESPLACRRCAEGRGCGAGLLGASGALRSLDVRIPAGMSLEPGDEVQLTIAPRHLLRAALLAYGLPLGFMLLAPGLAWLGGVPRDDGTGVVLALLGLTAGLVAGRSLLRRDAACEHFMPSIEARRDHAES